MTLDILRARQFFADFFYGEHHIPGLIKKIGNGWFVAMPGELASTDYNDLTRLVLMAHERTIRVSVRPLNFSHLKISIFARDPFSNSLVVGHPSIDEAIERHDKWNENHLRSYKINPQFTGPVEIPRDCPVTLLDLKGDVVDQFSSQTACATSIGVSRQAVHLAIVRNSTVKGIYKITINSIPQP